MNGRKIAYAVIYVGIAITFPALPLGGLRFIGGIFTGSMEGFFEGSGSEYVKEKGKEKAIDMITEVQGPIWKLFNPFE
jgi:hypothetical protein